MKKTNGRIAAAVLSLTALYAANAFAGNDDHRRHDHEHDGRAGVEHVILISFDGLHEGDIARCVASNACPNIALLAKDGITYTNAHTPGLSDSFPGLAAL